MPRQESLRCDNTGGFGQQFPAERLTVCRELPPLVVGEAELPPVKPSLEDSALLDQVDDSGLLLTLDPTGDGDDEERPRLDSRAHDGFYFALPTKAKTRISENAPVDEGLGLVRIFGHDGFSRTVILSLDSSSS